MIKDTDTAYLTIRGEPFYLLLTADGNTFEIARLSPDKDAPGRLGVAKKDKMRVSAVLTRMRAHLEQMIEDDEIIAGVTEDPAQEKTK